MDLIQKELLEEIAGLHEVPAGAYNIRANGKAAARNTTANTMIVEISENVTVVRTRSVLHSV